MKDVKLFEGMSLIDILWDIKDDDDLNDKTVWVLDTEVLFAGGAFEIIKVLGNKFWNMEAVIVSSDEATINITVREVEENENTIRRS